MPMGKWAREDGLHRANRVQRGNIIGHSGKSGVREGNSKPHLKNKGPELKIWDQYGNNARAIRIGRI